jgi:mRNA-degrading endonuclease RelE of RelBE toxin-antitoxin system
MEIGRFGFHRRASMTLAALSDAEQAKVLDRLKELADKPPSDWPARVVKRADVGTQLYLIRVDNSLRVLIDAPEDGAPEVVDIVRHEALQQFAKAE